MPIRRALLSVFDKTGVVELASALHQRGVHLLSTGGTYQALTAAGIPVTPQFGGGGKIGNRVGNGRGENKTEPD